MSRRPYDPPRVVPHAVDIANQFGLEALLPAEAAIDGIPVSQLVAQFGSPLFIFSERALRERMREFRNAFRDRYPRVRFGWSYKTNYLDGICGIFHQEGWDAEVVSHLEYAMARRLGIPGARIICNGASKPRAWCRQALDDGALIQIDHLAELDLLDELTREEAKPVRVGLRVNLRVEAMGVHWDRFGFNLENGEAMDAVLRLREAPGLTLAGLHCHLGTFITEPAIYAAAMRKLAALAPQVEEVTRRKLEYINAGGGFPSHNALLSAYGQNLLSSAPIARFAEAICGVLKESFARRNPVPELILEAGRALVDDAGVLVATVMGVRRMPTGERALVIDAGLNVLYTAHWYTHAVTPVEPSLSALESTTLHGPLCMNIDTVRRGVPLPPLEPGQQVVIHNVGAYNVTQWMQFSQLRPPVVLVTQRCEPVLLRRAETIEDVKGPEYLPESCRPRAG